MSKSCMSANGNSLDPVYDSKTQKVNVHVDSTQTLPFEFDKLPVLFSQFFADPPTILK